MSTRTTSETGAGCWTLLHSEIHRNSLCPARSQRIREIANASSSRAQGNLHMLLAFRKTGVPRRTPQELGPALERHRAVAGVFTTTINDQVAICRTLSERGNSKASQPAPGKATRRSIFPVRAGEMNGQSSKRTTTAAVAQNYCCHPRICTEQVCVSV